MQTLHQQTAKKVAHLAYTVHPGNGPYLVLMHGFLSSAKQWQPNLDALAQVCTPVTIELWGHGSSPAPDNPNRYLPQAYVEELEHIRCALNAEQWFLCGYSLSAGLTIRYTHTYPQHVTGHIFTNSSSALADDKQIDTWSKSNTASAEKIMREGQAAIERLPVHPRFARRLPRDIYDQLVADAQKLSPTGVALTLTQTILNAGVRNLATTNPRPALLCRGDHERRFTRYGEWAQAHMPNLEVVRLAAGHAVNLDSSDGFNKAVQRFVKTRSIDGRK